MDFSAYIDPELYVIIPLLYVIGIIIKKSKIDDKWIPLILGAVGVCFAVAYKLAADIPSGGAEILKLLVASLSQGILCAAASVYANNIVKQLKKTEKKDEESESTDNGDK